MINVPSLTGSRTMQQNNCSVLDITHLPTENMTDYTSLSLHTEAKDGQIHDFTVFSYIQLVPRVKILL